MIRLMIKSMLFIAVWLLSFGGQAAGLRVCDTDLSQQASPFQWQNLSREVPMYLLPGDAESLYRELLQRYLARLDPDDEKRTEVVQFIQIQEGLVAGRLKPLVKIGANPITNEPELQIGPTEVITVNCADTAKPYLIDILNLAASLEKIHDASYEVFRQSANRNIQRLHLQYQNLFDNGLPMWPQETWLNGLGLGESDAEAPDRVQWVLLRPSLGLALDTDQGIDDGELEASLGVEVGGFVYYLAEDFSSYWGLSALATLGEDAGPGYGVLLRYNQFMLGYSHRGQDTAAGIDEDRDYVFIGLDLYNLVMDKRQRFVNFREKVRANLEQFR